MIAAGSQSASALDFLWESCAVTAGCANLKISVTSETVLAVSLRDAPTVAEVLYVSVVHTVALLSGFNYTPSEHLLETRDQSSRIFKLSISEEEVQLRTCTPSDDSFSNL